MLRWDIGSVLAAGESSVSAGSSGGSLGRASAVQTGHAKGAWSSPCARAPSIHLKNGEQRPPSDLNCGADAFCEEAQGEEQLWSGPAAAQLIPPQLPPWALPHAEVSSAAAAEGGVLSRGRPPQSAVSSVPLTPSTALCCKARKSDVDCAALQSDTPAKAGYRTGFGFAKEAAL